MIIPIKNAIKTQYQEQYNTRCSNRFLPCVVTLCLCWFLYLFYILLDFSMKGIFISCKKSAVFVKSRFGLVIPILILCQLLRAQSPSFRHFDVDNGLPSSECYWVIQDSRSAVWIASDAGVTKYDGYSFITYTHANGLPDNTIFKIHEDRYGKVWFSSLSGQMAYYDYKTDSIYGIAVNSVLKHLNVNFPIDFCFDRKDTLWISLQETGLVKVAPPFYRSYALYKTGKDMAFIKQLDDSVFIYGQESRVLRRTSGKIESLNVDHEFYKVPGINHLSVLRMDDNHFLFSDGTQITAASSVRQESIDLYKQKMRNAITHLYKDSKGRVWISSLSEGLLCFNPPDFLHPVKNILPGEMVTCVYEDNEHGFWVTSLNNGVYYLPNLQTEYYSVKNGLSSDKLSSIARFNGMIYLTTSERKLNILNPVSGEITVRTDKEYYHVENDSRFLKVNTPYSTLYDNLSNRALPVNMTGTGEPVQITQFSDFDAGHLIGFSNSFLYLISKKDGTAKEWGRLPSRIHCLYKTDTCLFIGTRNGLFTLKGSVLKPLAAKNTMLHGRIENIIKLGKVIYIAVKGVGLLEWDGNDKLKIWNSKSGLLSNFIKALYSDSLNRLWIGTNRGITLLRREPDGNSMGINSINYAHGLVSDEVNGILVHSGYLYSATPKGLAKINISAFMTLKPDYPVYIEALYVNGQKRFPGDPLNLRHDQNFIDIHYKNIQASSNGNSLYKYRLRGLDTVWKYTRQIQAHFTTLPAGTYTFEVAVFNPERVSAIEPARVIFYIAAPFWKQWWFALLCIVTVGGCIYIIYRRNVNQLLKREQVKNQYEKLLIGSELKLLRTQMNPHFIFNAVNSIQAFIFKKQELEANKYLTKFARLMRKVLEYSKYESIPLRQDIELLQLYVELEALRAGFSFDAEFNVSNDIDTDVVKIHPMIIQPFVENAILHGILNLTGRRGKLQISFSKDALNRLVCVIDDNGVGLRKAKEIGKVRHRHKKEHSFGIEVAVNRLEAINFRDASKNEVCIREKTENGSSLGTQVTVVIDLKTEYDTRNNNR